MQTDFKLLWRSAFFLSALTASVAIGSAQTCTVDWNDVHQRIDGFGGGVVFLNPGSLDPVASSIMDTLFGTANTNQLGLTLLRIRIDPTTNWNNALLDGQKAVARGAGVLATPWTPPASMKDNNSLTNGGSLLPAEYGNYALYLKSFADYMSSNGAPLRAISIQNESDFVATYESCIWTPAEFQTFFDNNAAAIGSTPVMMPESFHYNQSLSDPTLNDSVAAANVSLIGGHLYGNGNAGIPVVDYPNAHNKGKPTWMTEFLVNDQTIDTAIITARQIHDCLTIGNMSAYIWWKALGDANGLVNASGAPQKRGFVMAQWSRFVHTNYFRIGVTGGINIGTNASISAYKDPNGAGFAIVAVNTNATIPLNQTFTLTNFNAGSVTPWITSSNLSLAVQAVVTVSNATFTYALPAQSVVTFVGQQSVVLSNTPPALQPLANQIINAGITLVVTNLAHDTDQPPQTLTFSLLNGPGTLNSSNGVFNWRPPVNRANTTNPVSVAVTDNGTPNLSATNNFKVVVNPLGPVHLSSITMSGGQVSLLATGPFGPDYTLLGSTNLANWSALYMTNSPVLPMLLRDKSMSTNPAGFYRIQLGP